MALPWRLNAPGTSLRIKVHQLIGLDLLPLDVLSLTPGPPPFSSMNSTPADSSALLNAVSFAAVNEVISSDCSARRTVANPSFAFCAKLAALHLMSARAARIWLLELTKLVPEDAKETIGHGLRAKRSKAGAISFDVLDPGEVANAPVQ